MGNNPWFTQTQLTKEPTLCGKTGCLSLATRVAIASPSHRIVTCDLHEQEILLIREMIKNDPRPAMRPTETVTWRRDDRGVV